jgi:ribonuclease BN (tRNA processing enzyme)
VAASHPRGGDHGTGHYTARREGLTTARRMLLEILGCHGGSVPKRRLPSFLINGHVLLEAGSVTSALPLGAQASIEHVLISHAHLDHTVGLAFLVDNIQSAQTVAGSTATVTAASIAPVVDDLRTHCFNNRLWPDFTKLPTPEDPALRFQTLREREVIEFGSLTVVPVPVQHAVPATGFIIHDGSAGLVFSGDTGPTDEIWKVAREFKGLHAIIVETAFPNRLENLATVSGHLTPALLQREMEKMPDAPLWVYHIKPAHFEETAEELERLGDRVHVLDQDQTHTF